MIIRYIFELVRVFFSLFLVKIFIRPSWKCNFLQQLCSVHRLYAPDLMRLQNGHVYPIALIGHDAEVNTCPDWPRPCGRPRRVLIAIGTHGGEDVKTVGVTAGVWPW